jgi:hypothetical protein
MRDEGGTREEVLETLYYINYMLSDFRSPIIKILHFLKTKKRIFKTEIYGRPFSTP